MEEKETSNENEVQKDLMILDLYLTTCIKKDFLSEAIWLAFQYKEKNPSWDTLKCLETSIWNWLLFSGENEKPLDPEAFLKKINSLKKKNPKKKQQS